jgi:alpha-tubulin suppressor-like RCC1 family protein
MSQLPAGSYRAVGAGRRFVCGIDVAGALLCRGEIGTPPSDGPFAVLSVGDAHACALREDRTLACWGKGGPDAPTDGSDESMGSWGQAIPPPGEFVFVAAGAVHSCALRADGEAVCWGAGKSSGDCQVSFDACGMSLPPPGPFVEIAAGLTNTCALRADRSVTCWGSNTGNRSTPPAGPQ